MSPVPAGPSNAGRTLAKWVWAQDGTGNEGWFGPGDIPPAWAASVITNPDVWE